MFAPLAKLRLQARISLLVTLGLLLIFIAMAWQGVQALQTATELVLNERLALARLVALHVDENLERTLERLTQVAARPTIDLEDGNMEPEKAELQALRHSQLFSYVFLLDGGGLVLWTEPYLSDVVGQQYLECPSVQQALRTGNPAIAGVKHALTPQSPVVAPMMPIRNRDGTVVGLLGAAIDPSSPEFTDILEGIAQGQTGYVQLVDENGIVMAHTEGRTLFQRSEHADLFLSLLQAGQIGMATHAVTEEGKGTFREVIAFAPLTMAPWGVAVEQAEAELLAPALALRRRLFLSAMGALVISFFLIWITTRSVVTPVRALVAASRRIAAGDLTTPVPPLGEDEIGELGRDFELMRQRLQQHREVLAAWGEQLETKVAERTRELSILYAIDRATAQSLELEDVLNQAMEVTLEALGFEAGGIYLLEPNGETMALQMQRGLSDRFVEAVQRIRLGEGIAGLATARGEPVVLEAADYPTKRLAELVVREGFQTLVSAPLVSGGKVVGALNLGTRRVGAFPPEELELLTAVGQQLGQAVQNARLYQETQQRLTREERMNELARALGGALELPALFPRLLPPMLELTGADAGTVAILDLFRQVITYPYHYNLPDSLADVEVPAGSGLAGLAMERRQPILLDDYRAHPAALTPWVEAGVRSVLAVPLQVGDQVVGAMGLFSLGEVRPFDEDTVAIAQAASHLAAVAIQRARLFEELQNRVQQLTTVYQVGKTVSGSLRIGDVLDFIIGAATQAVHAEGCYLFLWEEREERLVLRASVGFLAEDVGRMKYRLGEGLAGWVFLERQPANVPDVDADPRWKRDPQHEATLPAGRANNALVVPLVVGEKARGVLGVVNRIGAPAFTESDQSLLTTLAGQVAIAIENARLYEDVRGLSIAAIRSLATAIDARDPYTRGHSEGVTHLAVQIARELGWGGADLEMLEFAALLHDVGKIGIPDAILHKVEPLTLDERNIIRLHPYHSAQIIKPVEPLKRIVPWVYHHHEWWNGGGYPDGLKGEDIPLAARIIAVSDAYNAMTTDRPYRKARTHEEAVAELQQYAGTQFNPHVVEAFLRVIEPRNVPLSR